MATSTDATPQSSTPLAIIQALRALDPDMSLRAAAIFLLVCEHDGLSQGELVDLAGEAPYRVTRLLDQLGQGGPCVPVGSSLGLIVREPCEVDGRVRVVRLTAAGRLLRDRLNDLVAAAVALPDDAMVAVLRPVARRTRSVALLPSSAAMRFGARRPD